MLPLREVGDHITSSTLTWDFQAICGNAGQKRLEAEQVHLHPQSPLGIARTGGSMSGPVIQAIVKGMDVSVPGFLLEL